jgi:hypothetical protein
VTFLLHKCQLEEKVSDWGQRGLVAGHWGQGPIPGLVITGTQRKEPGLAADKVGVWPGGGR